MTHGETITCCATCPTCGGCLSGGCYALEPCDCPTSVQQAARTAFTEGQERAGFGVTAAGDTVPRVTMTPTMRVKLPPTAPFAYPPSDTVLTLKETAAVFRQAARSHVSERNVDDDVPSTLAEQVGALMPYMAEAAIEEAVVGFEEVLTLAGQRIVAGHAEHGSSLFTMSDADLERNILEEYADAIVYRAEQLRREAL